MDRTTLEVHIVDRRTGNEEVRTLGNWKTLMRAGVGIGSAPSCGVVLADPAVAPLHARYTAMSNHRFVHAEKGTTLRMPTETSGSEDDVDWRGGDIGYHWFVVGPYKVRFREGRLPVREAHEARSIVADVVTKTEVRAWAPIVTALSSQPVTRREPSVALTAVRWCAFSPCAVLLAGPSPEHADRLRALADPEALDVVKAILGDLIDLYARKQSAAAQEDRRRWDRVVSGVRALTHVADAGDDGWYAVQWNLARALEVCAWIDEGWTTDALVILVGHLLGAPYAARGCALARLDGEQTDSWGLLASGEHGVRWTRGTAEDVFAALPEDHRAAAGALLREHAG